MEYKKPELIAMGDAAEVIQSSLTKMGSPPDALQGSDFPSNTAAYEADE
jgi:hypothetical protein